ncbi:MAG TPA: hypothetical protein VF458_06380 [Ktedonobacteraceae bacterium]
MAVVRQRSSQEVKRMLESILRDVEPTLQQMPATYKEWHEQMIGLDAWQAIVLSNVCDLLPSEVRELVMRFQVVRDTVLYHNWLQRGK